MCRNNFARAFYIEIARAFYIDTIFDALLFPSFHMFPESYCCTVYGVIEDH